jgi:predicted GNAT family acetyltransferase
MQIERDEHGRRGAFFIERDGEWIAELAFTKYRPDLMIIDHTEVDKSLRGQSVGQQLVRAAVDYAREHKMKIRSRCRYAHNVLEETPEYGDVIV